MSRSLEKVEDVEEERRLAFVGITPMKELSLAMPESAEFRGQTLYGHAETCFWTNCRPRSESVDLSNAAGYRKAMDSFRGGSKAASAAWVDPGSPYPPMKPARPIVPFGGGTSTNPDEFEAEQVVEHSSYGIGKITEVNGFGAGAMRKVEDPLCGRRGENFCCVEGAIEDCEEEVTRNLVMLKPP